MVWTCLLLFFPFSYESRLWCCLVMMREVISNRKSLHKATTWIQALYVSDLLDIGVCVSMIRVLLLVFLTLLSLVFELCHLQPFKSNSIFLWAIIYIFLHFTFYVPFHSQSWDKWSERDLPECQLEQRFSSSEEIKGVHLQTIPLSRMVKTQIF